jgi:hypothetical protein
LLSDRKVSWEQWLLVAIQERVQAEQSFQVLRSYGDRLDLEAFDAVMAKVPDVEPIEIMVTIDNLNVATG